MNTVAKTELPRPDKLLQKKLIALAYTLVTLTAFFIAFIIHPRYLMFFLPLIGILTLICLILSLQILRVAEQAINYGGFANEIVRQSSNAKRIETFDGKTVLENDSARDLFSGQNILWFLQQHLADNRNNSVAFQQLKNAYINLNPTKISLSLHLGANKERTSWFQISLKIISLRKTDFFQKPFLINKIQKDTFLYWSFRDITAEHNMEQIFQTERLSMHDFLDYLPAALYITDTNYKIEYCNHIFASKIGKTREEIIGSDLNDYILPNSQTPPNNSSWNGIVHFFSTDGKDIETCIKQESFREGNEIKIRAAGMADLPNDNDLRAKLRTSTDEISWLFEFAPIGIIFADRFGAIKKCNNQAAKFADSTVDKLQGINLMQLIKKNDQHTLRREIDYVLQGQKQLSSMELTLNPSDKTATTYITPMKPVYSGQKSPADGFVLYIIDATEQKNLEVQFAQAQKMQALGQLAGGVAHDFNNLLTAIIGFCDLLLQRHGVGDPSFADLIQVKNNANRAAGLVRQLLAFSRKQPLQPKYIDVTENFMELSQMLKRVLGEKVTLKFHHGDNLGFIRVDPVQFSQVIINLAVNAKDAMNGKGVLTITTRTQRLQAPQKFGEEIIKPGDFVVIDVQDTGCGIAKENLNRIFEPFFSTKQNVVGSGTGLGLAMVYGIVRQTEGFIKVDSVVNQGTTFSIHLPRFENNPDAENRDTDDKPRNVTNAEGTPIINVQPQNSASHMPMNQKFIFGLNVSAIDKGIDAQNPHAGIKILFVEDEDSVRSFAVRALKKKGYDVTGCNSAENALEHLKTEKDFNLLVTDMVMPGMNGVELAAIVKEQIKDIKVILASGYSEEITRSEFSVSNEFEFLAKPFSLGDLTKKIFDVLNKA